MALVLHPHPNSGHHEQSLVYDLFHMSTAWAAPRAVQLPRRGQEPGQLRQWRGRTVRCAAVLDWMNTLYPNPSNVWVCGISFGAWIGMQL